MVRQEGRVAFQRRAATWLSLFGLIDKAVEALFVRICAGKKASASLLQDFCDEGFKF